MPASLALINQAYLDNPAGRVAAIGVWAGCGGIAMAAGPWVGGVLIQMLGWRSLFLVNLPLGLLAVALSARLAASARQPRAAGWLRLTVQLFGSRVFSLCAAVSLVSALLLYGLIFLLGLYFQRTLGFSPLWTGVAFLPLTVLVSIGSLMAGQLVRAFGSRWLIGGALVLYVAGFGQLLMSGTSPRLCPARGAPADHRPGGGTDHSRRHGRTDERGTPGTGRNCRQHPQHRATNRRSAGRGVGRDAAVMRLALATQPLDG